MRRESGRFGGQSGLVDGESRVILGRGMNNGQARSEKICQWSMSYMWVCLWISVITGA